MFRFQTIKGLIIWRLGLKVRVCQPYRRKQDNEHCQRGSIYICICACKQEVIDCFISNLIVNCEIINLIISTERTVAFVYYEHLSVGLWRTSAACGQYILTRMTHLIHFLSLREQNSTTRRMYEGCKKGSFETNFHLFIDE